MPSFFLRRDLFRAVGAVVALTLPGLQEWEGDILGSVGPRRDLHWTLGASCHASIPCPLHVEDPPEERAQEYPQIDLTQVAVFTLPDSFAITGITAGSTGRLLAWSENTSYLLHLQDADWQVLGRGLVKRPIAAAYAGDSNSIEVIDADLGQIVRFSANGVQTGQTGIDGLKRFSAAVRSDDGWYVVADPTTDPYIYGVSSNGQVHRVALVPALAGREHDSIQANLTLSPDPNGVLVSYRRPPFATFRVTHSGEVQPFSVPPLFSEAEETEARERTGLWVALPVLAGPHGYLQTYADLSSDRRLIAVHATGSSLAREVMLEVPVGFQASLPQESLLIGVTRLVDIEIRLYEWRGTQLRGRQK